MARRHSSEDEGSKQAQARIKGEGFSVGPANLPEGTHRRKVQKIKRDLIRSAKIKKSYSKIKTRESANNQPVTTEIHPERQAMLAEPESKPETSQASQRARNTQAKPIPYKKEFNEATIRNEERERKRREIKENLQRRQTKREEHEMFRKAIDKARKPDRKGQRKLGRESKLLPKMVENLMGRLNDQENALNTPPR